MGENVSAVILAADDAPAMQSAVPAVLHPVCGRSILDYVVNAAGQVADSRPAVVIHGDSGRIREHLGKSCRIVDSAEGGDSVSGLFCMEKCTGEEPCGYLFVLTGNMPLIRGTTLKEMLRFTNENHLTAAVLSGESPESGSNGISPVYCFDSRALRKVVREGQEGTKPETCSPEDVLHILKAAGERTGIYRIRDIREVMSVSDRVCLSRAETEMRRRINEFHMMRGVTILDPSATYIGADVRIGKDTVVYPGNVLEGSTVLGSGCLLYPNNRLQNAEIADGTTLQSSVILDSRIGSATTVGPYAYIRPGSRIGDHVRIGDFVEVKNSTIGNKTKVSHLTYIGDADLGQEINVGCGVVCVNYDGKEKHRTVIGDHAFVGCNANLVAPVEVEEHTFVAAGSTITEKVPAGALAIARARQVNKRGWVEKREQKKTEEK